MTDAPEWRVEFSLFGTSTSTVVQPEFDDRRVLERTDCHSRELSLAER